MPIAYSNGIKRPGSTTNWTTDQVKEILKCGQDPLYFAENYFYIVHPVKGKQKIHLHDFQKRMITTFKNNRKIVVLSARQIGKCLFYDQLLKIYSTETNEIMEMTILDFLELCENENME